MLPTNQASHNVALTKGYNFRQPEELAKRSFEDNGIDKLWRAGMTTRMLVNNGNVIPVQGFNTSKVVTVDTRSITKLEKYDPRTPYALGVGHATKIETFSFRVTTLWTFKERFDATDAIHSPNLNMPSWMADQVTQVIIPATDNMVLGVQIAHVAANNFQTTSGADIYHSIIDSTKPYMDRTDTKVADAPCLMIPPQTYVNLKKSDKFVRDNFASQRKTIWAGDVPQVDGKPVFIVPENRFSSTMKALMVHKSVTAFANPYVRTRYNYAPTGFHGTEVDWVSYLDTFIPPYQGVAVQGVA